MVPGPCQASKWQRAVRSQTVSQVHTMGGVEGRAGLILLTPHPPRFCSPPDSCPLKCEIIHVCCLGSFGYSNPRKLLFNSKPGLSSALWGDHRGHSQCEPWGTRGLTGVLADPAFHIHWPFSHFPLLAQGRSSELDPGTVLGSLCSCPSHCLSLGS